MKRINLTRTVAAFGVGAMLAIAPFAVAQEVMPGEPTGGQNSADNLGSIDTSQQTVTTTTTTTNAVDGEYQYQYEESAPLPDTGGEPLLLVLAGSMLIGGGWVLRRKMAQSES